MLPPLSHPTTDHAQCFATTHWSEVLAAKHGDGTQVAAALENLCRTYWYPLYAFLRREGRGPHDAQDLTQEFFARLLQGKFLENVSPQKGKFRSFLLAALKNFLCDEWDKATAKKRGGGKGFVSLDEHNAEALYLLEPDAGASAEELFEQRWALALLAQALARLREEFAAAGKLNEFNHLKVFLYPDHGWRVRRGRGEPWTHGRYSRRQSASVAAALRGVHSGGDCAYRRQPGRYRRRAAALVPRDWAVNGRASAHKGTLGFKAKSLF